jgi:hypothetical protein
MFGEQVWINAVKVSINGAHLWVDNPYVLNPVLIGDSVGAHFHLPAEE